MGHFVPLIRGPGAAVLSAVQQLTRQMAYEALMTIVTICHHTAQRVDHDRPSLFLVRWI